MYKFYIQPPAETILQLLNAIPFTVPSIATESLKVTHVSKLTKDSSCLQYKMTH